MLNRWIDFLIENIEDFENGFDLLPLNVICDKFDRLTFFDCDEWKTTKKISISQIIARYVLTNMNHIEWLLGEENNLENYVILIIGEREIKIDDLDKIEDIHKYININILKKDYLSLNKVKLSNPENKNTIWKKWIKYLSPPIFFILKKKIIKILSK